MSNRYIDKTTMGWGQERFQTTVWKEIKQARTLNDERRNLTIESLIKRYWKPVYCYLRRKGQSNDSAKDITQGFFYEVVIGRNLLQQVDQSKGKFRTILLTALDRYATDIYRKENSQKRSPTSPLISLESNDLSNLVEDRADWEPDQAFNYVWASELLQEALNTLKESYEQGDKNGFWNAFNDRVVKPIMQGSPAPSLTEICEKYGIDSEARASDMIYKVKHKFRQTMNDCLKAYVLSDSEAEEEFYAIFEILSKNGAR